MKLRSHTDLPVGVEKWIGPSHGQFCNRYLRRADDHVEVQHIYRYSKPSETRVMSPSEFDSWLSYCENV